MNYALNSFDDIRPYEADEIRQAFRELLADRQFTRVLKGLMPWLPASVSKAMLRLSFVGVRTPLGFQNRFMKPFVRYIIRRHTDGCTFDDTVINPHPLPERSSPPRSLPSLIPHPEYGILLDMVGGEGAQFYPEGFSKQYAPDILKRVWRAARQAGYGSFFPRKDGGMITDDHVPVNQIAGIPTIDIIPYYPDCPTSSFGPTWHTVDDTMEYIDRATLQAVGQTLIQVIYTE